MLLYILFASTETNTSTHQAASPAAVREHETLNFSVGGIPLTLSKEAIKKYSDSDFNKLLNWLESEGEVDVDREGRIIVPIEDVLQGDANLPQLVAYLKEFIETGTLQEFNNPTETIVHSYKNLHALAQRFLIVPLQENLEKRNIPQLVVYIKEFKETGTLKEFKDPTETIMRNYANLYELAENLSLDPLSTALKYFSWSQKAFYLDLSNFSEAIQNLTEQKDKILSIVIGGGIERLEKEEKILFQTLGQLPFLAEIVIDDSVYNAGGLKADGAKACAEAFKHNTTLTELSIPKGDIGNEGAIALAHMLETNTHLKALYLSENSITNQGVIALAEALKINTTLKSLSLSVNRISKEGAQALFEMLDVNTSLEELLLVRTEMGDEEAIALRKRSKPTQQYKVDNSFL